MATRWGFGPVFAFECLTSSRRWQIYAGRALLIGGVLVGLSLVWFTRFSQREFKSIQETAAVGSAFLDATLAVELVLALLVVPAATAGVVCQDKMRGGLTMMMVTDLSDAEIVLGKFASRLVAILGVIACTLPVFAMTTALGGVDPLATLGGLAVVVGVAVLGVAVPLTFSVWATKPHEALMATYAAWAVWLLSLLVVSETRLIPGGHFLYYTNPFWLLLGGDRSTPNLVLVHRATFLAGSLVVSMVFVAISTWRIRVVTVRQASGSQRRPGKRWLSRLGMPTPMLDRDPMLWREWHRREPSRWGRAIWWLYAAISTAFVLLAIFKDPGFSPGVGAFSVSIGLLMISVSAATALAEERSNGSLDILMTTPLSSRSILLAKWRGAYRLVPRLAVLPGVLAFGSTLATGHGLLAIPMTVLIFALVLAYGALLTSLGLALAVWQPRLGRAVGLSVGCYLIVTVIYPTIVLMATHAGPGDLTRLWVSPFFGIFIPLGWVTWSWGHGFTIGTRLVAMTVWVALTSLAAYILLKMTLVSFDRVLGRAPEHTRRSLPPVSRGSLRQKTVVAVPDSD
jgi:ABC-type transport system involved in multi-copper enzyme maturation permease subunit